MKKRIGKLISAALVLLILLTCFIALGGCLFNTIKVEYVFMDNGVEFDRKVIKASTVLDENTSTFKVPEKKGCDEFAYWQVEDKFTEIVTVGNNIVLQTETLTEDTVMTFNSVYIPNHNWGIWFSKTVPTENTLGVKWHECTDCGANEEKNYRLGDDLQSGIDWDYVINKANSDYGRKDLEESAYKNRGSEKIANMLKLYDRLESASRKFFISNNNAIYHSQTLERFHYIEIIDISDLNLTRNETLEAYSAFLCDGHLYYFISKNIFYNVGYGDSTVIKNIALTVDKDYIHGDIRKGINETVMEFINSFDTLASQKKTKYGKALAINDEMISRVSYDTPNKPWAHNILGVALEDPRKGPVCESYAKAYNMLLNFYGVETIYVTGSAKSDFSEPHAWNLIKLDDSEWYWVDTTWNDSGDSTSSSMMHRYFAVGSNTFLYDHNPSIPELTVTNGVVDYMYKLPTASQYNYGKINFSID